jgi:heptose I phosphotransferase
MKLELSPLFQKTWKNKDPFLEVEKITGEVYRQLEARKTLSFELENQSFFIKIHRGIGWYEIIENLIRLRLPVLGARNEYHAIKRLEKLKVDTMKTVAFGEKGLNPAKQISFIITEDLINTISLEDYCLPWKALALKKQAPDFKLKQALIAKLAQISRTLHQNGINHRDYYICHFLLDISNGKKFTNIENLKISLIDLHRAQLRNKTPQRWLIKDIASLYFSAMDIGLTKRDFLRFILIYNQCSLRQTLKTHKVFWQKVETRGAKLWDRKQRKGDAI